MTMIERAVALIPSLLLLLGLLVDLSNGQTCPDLDQPENGMISFSDGTNTNSQATYTCNEGFELDESNTRFCRSTGVWTGPDRRCLPVDCGSLSSPVNGQVVVPITTFGSYANYSCNTGFALDGDETRVCQSNREWSGDEPTCILDCGSLDNPENGAVMTTGTREGDRATYSCSVGYEFNENSTIERTCGENGTWSGDAPNCTIVDCGDLTDPPNGVVSLVPGTIFGSEASYSCDTGYTLNGCPTRMCQASGNWSNSVPECIIADCGPLENPLGGVVELNRTTFGSVAEYVCNEGFIILGNTSNRSCQANGRWAEQPICIGIECELLTAQDNGSITIGPRTVGSLVIYTCDDGFTLNVPTPAFRTCQLNGSWSEDQPTCDPVDCGDLSDIPNGSVDVNGTTFRSTATYSCYEGFGVEGSSERICEATGQWSGNEPTCESQCPVECDVNAECLEIEGINICICLSGFEGNGQNCTDIDECASNPCHSNADCTDTLGSYVCTCRPGFEGDGVDSCLNINECLTIGCDANAICVDLVGSYNCFCTSGFAGDGVTCQDINECVQVGTCDENAECTNTPGSFECTCREDYFGNGINCTEQCSFNLQIILEEIRFCDQWRFVSTALKLSQITESLRELIREQCITRDSCVPQFEQNLNIVNEQFTCGPGNRPLFRAVLRGKERESCDEIESILNNVIKNGAASVVVQGNRLSVADFCEVEFDTFTDPIECNEPTTLPPATNQPSDPVSVPQSDFNLSSQDMISVAAGIAGVIVLVVIITSIVFIVIVVVLGLKGKKKKSHAHYFEHDLTSPDGNETVLNNSAIESSSPLRPTYSNFNTPDPAVVARMSTFNPRGDVIPTLIRSYSNNSLSRNRIHTTVVENHGARELMDDEYYVHEDHSNNTEFPSP